MLLLHLSDLHLSRYGETRSWRQPSERDAGRWEPVHEWERWRIEGLRAEERRADAQSAEERGGPRSPRPCHSPSCSLLPSGTEACSKMQTDHPRWLVLFSRSAAARDKVTSARLPLATNPQRIY